MSVQTVPRPTVAKGPEAHSTQGQKGAPHPPTGPPKPSGPDSPDPPEARVYRPLYVPENLSRDVTRLAAQRGISPNKLMLNFIEDGVAAASRHNP